MANKKNKKYAKIFAKFKYIYIFLIFKKKANFYQKLKFKYYQNCYPKNY